MKTEKQKTLDVAIVPHPFAVERVQHKIPSGQSVAAILEKAQPDPALRAHAHVYLNGDYVEKERWKKTKPKAGTVLTIRMVPMGGRGGGKNPLRTILSLAVTLAAPQIAGAFGGIFGQTSFLGLNVGRLISGGIGLLGRLALNALAPPARARFVDQKESPTLFIQGARNQSIPFGRVPRVLGKHRMVPPLGALPYTETVGNDQYLRMLFIWGYGPLQISDLKIGETPLSDFTNVEIETRSGYDTDAPITLYSNSVLQNDLQVNLTAAASYVMRTSETDADELSVDITLPRGLFKLNSAGTKTTSGVSVEVQYSPKGLNQWSAGAGGYTTVSTQNISAVTRPPAHVSGGVTYVTTRIDRIVLDPASGAAKRISGTPFIMGIDSGSALSPAIPDGMLPIAKIERRSDDAAVILSSRITDERDLTLVGKNYQAAGDFLATSSVSSDTVTLAAGGLKFGAVEITAKQSSAIRKSVSFKVPRGQYDVRVRRITADATDENTFDETSWTALRTIRYTKPVIMTGVAMTAIRIKATDQLNGVIDKFNGVVRSVLPDWNGSGWTEQVTSNPAALYRHVLQGKANARPLADNRLDLAKLQAWHERCTANGREFNAVIDYDVSVHEVLQNIAAAGRASPTILDGKWSVIEDLPQTVPIQHFTPRNTFNFKGEKSFDARPHALRVRFVNREKGWQQDERLVYDDGYDAATATAFETLSLNGITNPAQVWKDGRYHLTTARARPETYSFFADLEHIVCTRGDLIRFTHDVPMFGLMSARVVAIAETGGVISTVTLDAEVTMEAGRSYALRFRKKDGATLVASVVTVVGTSKTLTLSTTVSLAAGPEAGDMAMFGESGKESVELIVKSVEPQNDLSAKITCMDVAPDVHTADAGSLPPFNSIVTAAQDFLRPPAPVLAQIQSGLDALIRQADGSFLSRIIVTVTPPLFHAPLDMAVEIKGADETDFRAAEVIAQSARRLSITDVTDGEIYDIRLRYKTQEGVFSSPLLIPAYLVEGANALPSDIANFNMNVLGSTAYLSWDAANSIGLSHYILRYAPQTTGVNWGSATDLITRIALDTTSVSVPAAVGTYLIKAVDIVGRQSVNATLVVSTVSELAGYNAVLNVTEEGGFAGTKANCEVVTGTLRLANSSGTYPASGTYDFSATQDLGAVYTSRLTAGLNVTGVDASISMDGWTSVDLQESWDEDVDPSLFGVQLQLQTTNDNPAGTPVWGAWMPFVVGDYTARAFKFRAILTSAAATVTPVISKLQVDIDMPDRIDSARNIASNAAGSTITFSRAFKAIPAVTVTAQNLATGDYYAITNMGAGSFDIRFFNAAGTGISRTFDYMAQGYGEQI